MSKFLFTLITLFAIKFSIFCDNCKKRYYFLQFGQSSRGLNIADHKRIDYDYDYYGYGDYRGGYSDPYYDDFYRYEDYYYDYAPPTAANAPRGGRGGRQPQPEMDDSTMLFYEVGNCNPGNGPTQGGRGRGAAGRGRAGGPAAGARGANRGARPGGAGARGRPAAQSRGPPQQQQRNAKSLPGKRKLDGGNQNQGESKRRYQQGGGGWGSAPLVQQPLGGLNGTGADPSAGAWHQDSYQAWS